METINFNNLLPPGDRYNVLDLIGEGAFGKVFNAVDTIANKAVAVKIQDLEQNGAVIDAEYKILRDLTGIHCNIVDFYGIFRNGTEIWFVQELCEGGNVLELVQCLLLQNRRMNEEHIAYILKETVKALSHLHEKCLIHRDVKAKNLLLTKTGEVKICDFGTAVLADNQLGKVGECIGSPAWMAPEVVSFNRTKAEYDSRVDVWSLGITAIELGDGNAPYEKMHPTRALFQISTNPPPNLAMTANWSVDFVDFIDECLTKNPEHRPYMVELIDHPFLTQIPENNYHLTLEIKSLMSSVEKMNIAKPEDEAAIVKDCVKYGPSGKLEEIFLEDIATLEDVTEQNVLDLLKSRFETNQFETFIGDILLVLNPNETRDSYGEKFHEKYRFKSRSDNAPHIYSIADSAYQNALHHNIPQRIVLGGETGSGKTSNFLHLVDHLLHVGDNKYVNLPRIKDAIFLIQELTHAATPQNESSTRCVFTAEFKYAATGKVTGAVFSVQQLEKWRISSIDMTQGPYNFMSEIFNGLSETNKLEEFFLNPTSNYRYLRNHNGSSQKFEKIIKILQDFGFDNEAITTILSIVSAILNIGEIRVSETDLGDGVIESGEEIEHIGRLLKIEPNKIEWALTNFCLSHKGAVVKRRRSIEETREARDVFANNLYLRLVDYIVGVINQKLEFGKNLFGEKHSIKVFDHFGFECFKTNDISELFVNCFNEQMQYHYLQRIFSWECLEALEEEIEYKPTSCFNNKKTLDQLLSKENGVFTLIDEASKAGHTGRYVIEFLEKSEKERVIITKKSEFSVLHYTGKVKYNILEIPDKNRDYLPVEVVETLRLSDNSIIKTLFTNKLNKQGTLVLSPNEKEERYIFAKKKTENRYSQIKRTRTCVQTFKALSLELLKELSIGCGSGGTHFVRCIRTNLNESTDFNEDLVRQQVRGLAVTETAKVRQFGYPHRIPFSEFLRRYQFLAFDFDENVEITKENCRLLLVRLKMEGWTVGKSKIFLKYYNEEYLARLYETQVKKIVKMQSILRRFLAKCRVARKSLVEESSIISRVGGKRRIMSEEEAAAIIQKAYRESTFKRVFTDFAKDFKILDENECNFIQPFADKWRQNSIFHVLVLYRASNLQESFNFCQQVHLYNIGLFYELKKINSSVCLEAVDVKAQVCSWMEDTILPVRKIPFRLDEIPFYDSSELCHVYLNLGNSIERDESWDLPYRWRELISSKSSVEAADSFNEENVVCEVFEREEIGGNEQFESEEEDKVEASVVKIEDVDRVNSNSKPANQDFSYIKSAKRSVDPIEELKKIGQMDGEDNEAPFNFKKILRKTELKIMEIEKNEEEVKINGVHEELEGDKVKLEIYPGVTLEGILYIL